MYNEQPQKHEMLYFSMQMRARTNEVTANKGENAIHRCGSRGMV